MNSNLQENILKTESVFSTMPIPNSEFLVLTRDSLDKSGKVQQLTCPCHKTGFAVPRQTIAGVQMQNERMPCTTQCLRATIVEEDGKLYYRMDCEANVLKVPLKMEETDNEKK